MTSSEKPTPQERVDLINTQIAGYKQAFEGNFDNDLWSHVEAISCIPGEDGATAKAIFSAIIPPRHINHPVYKTTHGGAIATLLDTVTSFATIASDRSPAWGGATGTTRVLQCTYLRPIQQGEKLLIECDVLQMSKRLGTISAVIKREKDGVPLVLCQHEKINSEQKSWISPPSKL